jgi:dTDP-4-amino-4,6-dideoxygalactose transaminase
MKERIPLATPHMCGRERDFVENAFVTNWVAPLGPHVDGFEQEIAAYIGVENAAALSSGTAAIHMALKSIGVKPKDIVFCSSLTFAATCNPIFYENAIPVFIDSDYETFNMSPIALEKAFKKYPNPKAVIVVDLYGQSADMDPIIELCNKHNVPLIEDAAEALGSTYKGKKCGTFGKIGVLSFNGNKIITTSGGGMLLCDDPNLVQKVRFWSTQSRDKARYYQHTELGYNYRMSNICAAIGRGQLTVLEERIAQKKLIYDTYKKGFKDIKELQMMNVCDFGQPNYWLSVVVVDKNSKVKPIDILLALEAENIESRPVWKPMQLQPIFAKYDFFSTSPKGISVSEDLFNRGLCLPSDTKMTVEQQQRVITVIQNMFRG